MGIIKKNCQKSVAYKAGFSLLELLIVVLIIGIVSSMAVLYIDTAHERLKSEVQVLVQLITMSRDQAIITGKPMAVTFEETEYYFSQWDGKQWQRLNKKPFRGKKIDPHFKLLLVKTADINTPAALLKKLFARKNNQVYFLPVGETEAFYLEIKTQSNEKYRINVSFMGEISVDKVSG